MRRIIGVALSKTLLVPGMLGVRRLRRHSAAAGLPSLTGARIIGLRLRSAARA